MKRVIFYSWQADLPNNTNRGFIQAALEEAARTIATDLDIEPVIERDTQNVPGSPDIATTIFRKIGRSDVFVADVSFINPKSAKRRTPNPNVLLELGYAMHALGDDRIILVMNRAYGLIEALPFDLKMRRVIPYDMAEDAPERAPERKRLSSVLATAITIAIASIPPPAPVRDATDEAISTIEAGTLNTALLRRAMQELTNQLAQIPRPRFVSGGTVEDLLGALQQTVPVVRSFTRLAEAIAGMNDQQAAITLYKSFSAIFEHYDNPRGFEGRYDERDFDYWKFLGHELLTTLIAKLLTEERYEIIAAVLEETITVTTNRRTMQVTFGHASEYLRSFEPLQKEKRRISYHADLLHQRHATAGHEGLPDDGPLHDALTFDALQAADYFLYLRGEVSDDEPQAHGFAWIPWSSVYLTNSPDFIHHSIRAKTAAKLATALGVNSVSTLKERLRERAGRLELLWRNGFFDQPLSNDLIDRIGTR